MKKTFSTREVANILFNDKYAGFTCEGSKALAERLAVDLWGENFEFNPIAIRRSYGEYESALEAADKYTDSVESEEEALEYLENHTSVICFKGGIIIQHF